MWNMKKTQRHPGDVLIAKRALIIKRMRSTDPQECESLTAQISLLAKEYELAQASRVERMFG